MDGYVNAVEEVVGAALSLITIVIGLFLAALPENLATAACYSYSFLLAAPAFLGYIVSAGYYAAESQGLGADFCEYSGMAYGYSDYIYQAIETIEGLIPSGMNPDDPDDMCATSS